MTRLIYWQDVQRKQIILVICGSSATGGPQLNLSTIFSLVFLGGGLFVDVLHVQLRYCAAPGCGSARLTDVIGQSLTFIGIPLSLCQREEGSGRRAS